MNKTTMSAAMVALFALSACQSEKENKFEIGINHVGTLQKTTAVDELEGIFSGDSLVRDTPAFGISDPRIKVYEKGGDHLLTLTPGTDSLKTIENINIHDPRFRTEEGVSLESTFKDIRDNYSIKKLVTFRNNVVVFIKESDVYFTIDRKELPENLRYNPDAKIEAVQIPDAAKIKYMMVGWE
ncbi:hypothetical protein PP178_13535 [Zeaxanthinibacter sp. PT1]|uniref:hypothetical protein n=1 Tax=Zeaxanthinibacter TaxID=561554 RepID=UPI0023490B9E|nr:hypothetical protein [Zeaxanthinibacter sp. PT1]MDC6352578.1 hypothetical protein [Zeaxanthinibacter sp. PT1]